MASPAPHIDQCHIFPLLISPSHMALLQSQASRRPTNSLTSDGEYRPSSCGLAKGGSVLTLLPCLLLLALHFPLAMLIGIRPGACHCHMVRFVMVTLYCHLEILAEFCEKSLSRTAEKTPWLSWFVALPSAFCMGLPCLERWGRPDEAGLGVPPNDGVMQFGKRIFSFLAVQGSGRDK